jgi:excisionase family DNA binding protein
MRDDFTAGHDVLLSVAQVAARLRVSRMSVYRMIRSARLPAVRVGHTYRISKDALARYLDNALVTAPPL